MSPKLLIILVKHWKNLVIKFPVEGPISLVFVNSSQIFSEGLLVIVFNKVQSCCYTSFRPWSYDL